MPAPQLKPLFSPLYPESETVGAALPPPPAQQHGQDLAMVRTMVMVLINMLERDLVSPSLEDTDEEKHALLSKRWGEKENAVGALVKLTSILFKLVPLEQQVYEGKCQPVESTLPLTEEDEAILARYASRVID